jgi:hypothetical protein
MARVLRVYGLIMFFSTSQPMLAMDSEYDENDDSYDEMSLRDDPDVLPEATKRRVKKATAGLTGNRCLIENTDEANAVDYVHCLARDESTDLVSIVVSWLIALPFQWNA